MKLKLEQRLLIGLKHTIRVKVLNTWDWVRCAFDNVSLGVGGGVGSGTMTSCVISGIAQYKNNICISHKK